MEENYIESKTKTNKILKDFASTELRSKIISEQEFSIKSLSISSPSSPLYSDKPLKLKLTSRPGSSLVAQTVKNLLAIWERPGFDPWVGKILWRSEWQPTPIFLPGESPWTEDPGRLQSMG